MMANTFACGVLYEANHLVLDAPGMVAHTVVRDDLGQSLRVQSTADCSVRIDAHALCIWS